MTAGGQIAGAERELPLLAIYADESCLGNGREGSNPGGAAGVIEYVHAESGNLGRWDYWISEPATASRATPQCFSSQTSSDAALSFRSFAT